MDMRVDVVTMLLPTMLVNDVKKIAEYQDEHAVAIYRRAIYQYANEQMSIMRNAMSTHPDVPHPVTFRTRREVYSLSDNNKSNKKGGAGKPLQPKGASVQTPSGTT